MGVTSRRDAEEFDSYLNVTRENLLREIADPSINEPLLNLIADREITCVLDVGCGIGQALFPLAVSKGALGVGLDAS